VGFEVEDVSSFFDRLKTGIERGDEGTARRLMGEGQLARAFFPMFETIVGMLQKEYKGKTFPLQIERTRILSDGRAKVAVLQPENDTRCVFTLLPEQDEWKLSYMEFMMMPLYSIPDTPYQDILRLDDQLRSMISAELEIVQISNMYHVLNARDGKEAAQRFFLDGGGFRVEMDAWLPFIEGAAQFALYTAILETNLRGSTCTLPEASEERATLEMKPMAHLDRLRAAQFANKIPETEYKELCREIMADRARHCSLALEIRFEDTNATLTVGTI
jgi:hypothetical protein